MKLLKGIVRFVIFQDWTWSVIACFLVYFGMQWGPQEINGIPVAYYAINWLQALAATAGVMSGLMAIVRIGMWFNVRIAHNWFWSKKKEDEKLSHKRSPVDFINLTAWQRTVVVLLISLCFFFFAFFLFLQFLKMGQIMPS